MTLKEALTAVRDAYPGKSINIEVSCWWWGEAKRYESIYSVWNGEKHLRAATLDVAVALALAAVRKLPTEIATESEEPVFAEAAKLCDNNPTA